MENGVILDGEIVNLEVTMTFLGPFHVKASEQLAQEIEPQNVPSKKNSSTVSLEKRKFKLCDKILLRYL